MEFWASIRDLELSPHQFFTKIWPFSFLTQMASLFPISMSFRISSDFFKINLSMRRVFWYGYFLLHISPSFLWVYPHGENFSYRVSCWALVEVKGWCRSGGQKSLDVHVPLVNWIVLEESVKKLVPSSTLFLIPSPSISLSLDLSSTLFCLFYTHSLSPVSFSSSVAHCWRRTAIS